MNIEAKLTQYYRFHAKIYDMTRWLFLFGRTSLLHKLTLSEKPLNILEVGCGTGYNLVQLRWMYPNANITGVDLSRNMLEIAEKKLSYYDNKVRLINTPVQLLNHDDTYDLIIFSYTLSMINPDPEAAVKKTSDYLRTGGIIAVVDFQHSSQPWFKKWMWMNHVRMENHLIGLLSRFFTQQLIENYPAYLGLWSYFYFLGNKPPSASSHTNSSTPTGLPEQTISVLRACSKSR